MPDADVDASEQHGTTTRFKISPRPQSEPTFHSLNTVELTESIAKKEPAGSELMLTLLSIACSSWRVTTTLNPSPLKSLLSNGEDFDNLHVSRVQTALKCMPAIGAEGFHKPLKESGLDTRAVAHEAIVPEGHAMLINRTRGAYFMNENKYGIRYEVYRRERGLTARGRYERVTDQKNTIRAFHGSSAENWWAILRNGLQVQAGFAAANGRVFGDALYLSTDFDTAAGFSKHSSVPKWSPLRISGVTVVGEFEITLGSGVTVGSRSDCPKPTVWGVPDVPNEYVIVEDANKVVLIALHVLVTLKKRYPKRHTLVDRWQAKKFHSLQSVTSVKMGSIMIFVLVMLYLRYLS